MVKQYTEKQYDDDLTLSTDEYDDSYYSDADDLFELSTDDESPISRLKSLVLSIDWEITDEVLLQFNEELLDLKGIWAGEPINLVYLQALEKLSKYIYQNKADSHPNAIKLLLTFYYNLENIVSSQILSEEQKKETLLEDVKKFENLKRQIKQKSSSAPFVDEGNAQPQKDQLHASDDEQLLTLKAIVLGIDWEITDQDLNGLRREVTRLEEKFSENRPKLILLQGIGTLAAYIKVKKSDAHPDVFKILQLFYDSLEKIVQEPLSLEEEKSILFPAVERFNAFKKMLGPTIGPDAVVATDDDGAQEDDDSVSHEGSIAPALSDVSEEEEAGFQAEKEALALGLSDAGGVISHIDDFFGESVLNQPLAGQAAVEGEKKGAVLATATFEEKDFALRGVDVEIDDEDDQVSEQVVAGIDTVLPHDLERSNAPSAVAGFGTESPAMVALAQKDELPEALVSEKMETTFPAGGAKGPGSGQGNMALDKESALKGVDVETEADDDSDELSLPMEGEELAPALASMDEESLFSSTVLEQSPAYNSVTEEIVGTIDGLFLAHDDKPAVGASDSPLEKESVSDLKGQEIENEEVIGFEDWLTEDSKVENSPASAVGLGDVHMDSGAFVDDMEQAKNVPLQVVEEVQSSSIDFVEAQAETGDLTSFFVESDLDQGSKDDTRNDENFESLKKDLIVEEGVNGLAESADAVEEYYESDIQLEEPDRIELSEAFPGREEQHAIEQSSGTLFAEPSPIEDEVIFELFHEKDEPYHATPPENEGAGEMPAPGAGIASGIGEVAGLAGGLLTVAKVAEKLVDHSALSSVDPSKHGLLSDLQGCIEALKIEINDTVIAGLFKEISVIRGKWADKPLEKAFLQLLSTITQHIDNYRYESSAEAYGLLVSVSQAMTKLQDGNFQHNQEMLLGETLKVLEWQQGMLFRQAVKKGDQLMFADPLRTDKAEEVPSSDARKDFDDILGRSEDSDAATLLPAQGFNIENPIEVDALRASADRAPAKKELAYNSHVGYVDETIADDLKKEIAALRQTIQLEMAELRRELIKD